MRMCDESGEIDDDAGSPNKTYEDLITNWPVASSASSVFYKNKACAQCHGENLDDLVDFDLNINCDSFVIPSSSLTPIELFNLANRETVTYKCKIEFEVPESFSHRRCKVSRVTGRAVSTCERPAVTLHERIIERACNAPFAAIPGRFLNSLFEHLKMLIFFIV